MCDLDKRCVGYKGECNDFDNLSAGYPTCFIEMPLKAKTEPATEVPCSALLSVLLDKTEERMNVMKDTFYEDSTDIVKDIRYKILLDMSVILRDTFNDLKNT